MSTVSPSISRPRVTSAPGSQAGHGQPCGLAVVGAISGERSCAGARTAGSCRAVRRRGPVRTSRRVLFEIWCSRLAPFVQRGQAALDGWVSHPCRYQRANAIPRVSRSDAGS